MDTTVSIRPLTASDRAAAVALWHAAGLTRPWNPPEQDFDRAVEGATSTVLGALSGERLVATAMCGDDGHRGWIYYVAVENDHRGMGMGRTIMAAAESWLHQRGANKVQVMVRHDNDAVTEFYDRLGYGDDRVRVLSRCLEGGPEAPSPSR